MSNITLLSPGDFVIDSAGKPDPAKVAANGIPAVSLYTGHGKYNGSMAQILALWSYGISVILNEENNGDEALQGYRRGVTDAHEAITMAQSWGWRGECPIIYSATDFDVQPEQFAVCDDYYAGVQDVHQKLHWGPYGKSAYINHMHDTGRFPGMYGWQAGGWRYGFDSDYAYMRQNYQIGKNTWAYPSFDVGADEDTNLIVYPFPAWGPPKGASMQYPLWVESGGTVVVSNEPGVWHRVTGAEFYGVLHKGLDDPDVIHVDQDTLNELYAVDR